MAITAHECDGRGVDWSDVEGTWWRLRAPSPADAPAIAAHGRHGDASWIGIGASAPPERAQEVASEFLKGTCGAFGLVHLAVTKESDAIVAMVGAKTNRPGTVEIVYGVAPAFRRRGLATEILARVTRAARTRDRLTCELVIDAGNAESIRVAEKCGYRFAGTRRSLVEATGETYEDLVFVAR